MLALNDELITTRDRFNLQTQVLAASKQQWDDEKKELERRIDQGLADKKMMKDEIEDLKAELEKYKTDVSVNQQEPTRPNLVVCVLGVVFELVDRWRRRPVVYSHAVLALRRQLKSRLCCLSHLHRRQQQYLRLSESFR